MAKEQAREETSAGGVVYRVQGGEARFLLIRDSYGNWGFPKGHLKKGELPERAALREVREETGLTDLRLVGAAGTIEWWFRFRGRRVHKRCHFFVIESPRGETVPQLAEGITEAVWVSAEGAREKISYENAREVLQRAVEVI